MVFDGISFQERKGRVRGGLRMSPSLWILGGVVDSDVELHRVKILRTSPCGKAILRLSADGSPTASLRGHSGFPPICRGFGYRWCTISLEHEVGQGFRRPNLLRGSDRFPVPCGCKAQNAQQREKVREHGGVSLPKTWLFMLIRAHPGTSPGGFEQSQSSRSHVCGPCVK